MTTRIEDYGFVGDCRTGALISRFGRVDWLCVPRLDSPSIFAALLGSHEHGSWSLKPTGEATVADRHYDGDTMILVTRWETESGIAEVHEFMPINGGRVDLVRRVVGITGTVEFTTSLRMRFDYARAVPWVRQVSDGEQPGLLAIAGPDAVLIRGVALHATDQVHRADFAVAACDHRDLVLTWFHSYTPQPDALDVDAALLETRQWWTQWAGHIEHNGPHHDRVVRSLITLRALSNLDTGGIVAAATTSLPEMVGGERNWDYRYVWLRDAALTLDVLIRHGFVHVADHWRTWLMRAIAGDPARVQILYGIAGERDLPERELSLPGYEDSAPVRIGNAAVDQFQADTLGEVMCALHAARDAGLPETDYSWPLQRQLLKRVEAYLDQPDQGIWEMRGQPRFFTHSRVMGWAAFDRGVKAIEDFGLSGPLEKWKRHRDELRAEIDRRMVDPDGGYFVQYEGTDEVDAALLQLPQVGFCAPDDPRMLACVERIERDLMPDGLVARYRCESGVDGVAGTEHPFLACTFWLVEQYARSGRVEDAETLMTRACGTASDLGLFSEEYDPRNLRQVGNVPQALSHLAFVRAADALADAVN
ncbi:glycoside hydrolase family 15 protein [Gordonia oryzae]|uniref:Glycoside hydrolase family 15 protein n=1 Tax=Gordonia oryzae TaxID=2487349 RepID=A0A3N4GIP5_9ACTN|nr:glycoside hydrolase family 15 protein [Gordonia oryzae]RPA58510.1 glycoside hydrolase family 15 protein [Gordonia oryzae]